MSRDTIGNSATNSAEYGLQTFKNLWDLGAYGLESGARHLFGNDAVTNLNQNYAGLTGANPRGAPSVAGTRGPS